MARKCTVCMSSSRTIIDEELLRGRSYRSIAKQYDLSESAIYRHRSSHISKRIAQAYNDAELLEAESLLGQVRALHARTTTILAEAEENGDLKVALQAIREARNNLELLAKFMGELNEGVTVNIESEWPALRSAILGALEPYPEARTAVTAALSEADGC